MITFKLKERATGLARVTAGPRGWDIKVDGKRVGAVSFVRGQCLGTTRPEGWYYVVSRPFPYVNTHDKPVATPEEAKAAARAYIKSTEPTDS